MKPRIYFATNWPAVFDQPQAGGPRILLQHIAILNRNGFEARLVLGRRKGGWLHRRRSRRPDFALTRREFARTVSERDFVVLPAIRAEEFAELPGARKVLFVQNGSLLFDSLEIGSERSYPWHSPDLRGIICESEYDRELLELLAPGCPVHRVFNAIEPGDFPLVPWERKENLVVTAPLMGYKNRWHTATLAHLLLSRSDAGVGVTPRPSVEVIQGIPPGQVPDLLGRAKVLLFLSTSEGFGLLPAEAMLSGTAVIGSRGQAYDEFVPDPYLHAVGDFSAMVRTVETLLAGELDEAWRRTVQDARARAERYTPQAQEASVVEAWSRIVEA